MSNNMKAFIFLVLLLCLSCKAENKFLKNKAFIFNLYTDEIPCDSKTVKDDYKEAYKGHIIKNVRNPEIEIFLPDRFEKTKVPLFIIIPGNDTETIYYGSQGKRLFDEMKKLDIGVAIWTYRLPFMTSKDCKIDIVKKDFKEFIKMLKKDLPKWSVDLDELGVIMYDSNIKTIFNEINTTENELFIKHQIYLQPNLEGVRLDKSYELSSKTNIMLMTNTSKRDIAEQKLLDFHEELLSQNYNSTLVESRNNMNWNESNYRPFEEKFFPWIIRKVQYENWGRQY